MIVLAFACLVKLLSHDVLGDAFSVPTHDRSEFHVCPQWIFVCWVSPSVYRHMIGQNFMVVLITVMKALTQFLSTKQHFHFLHQSAFAYVLLLAEQVNSSAQPQANPDF